MNSRLKICVVTGSRAEFGIWRPVLVDMNNSKLLQPHLVVTGMHLLKDFGNTVNDIKRLGIPIAAQVPMYGKNEAAAKSLARATEGLATAYRKLKPQLIMLLGDRLEMLAAANAALAERIPIAHLHGGETAPGIWDEQIRHAITKMAHLHFCATKTAAARIRQMGEDPASIHVVGAPALDFAVRIADTCRQSVKLMPPIVRESFRDRSPFLLLHPSSPDEHAEYTQARMLIRLLLRLFPDKRIDVLGPNNDPGYQGILRAYEEAGDYFHLSMSMPQAEFWMAIHTFGLLVGNSSSGIIEAATFGAPVINIGPRQSGRERNANVIDVDWNDVQIVRALRKATTDKPFLRRVAQRKNVYGDGRASARIVKVLEQCSRSGKINLRKMFCG